MDRMQIDMVLSQQSATRIERIVEVLGPERILEKIVYLP